MGVLEDIKENYPTLAFLVNDPEVGPLLRDAVNPDKGFSPQQFQSRLYQTKWFRSRSTAQRTHDIQAKVDPGEFKKNLTSNMTQVRSMATQLGLKLSPAEIRFIATTNMRNGVAIGSDEFNYNLMRFAKSSSANKFGQGAIKGAAFEVNNVARSQFYLPMTQAESYRWGVEMAMGTKDEKALRAYLSERAASLYPHLKDQLAGGASMEDIFSGHRSIIAQELELSPETVDFTKGRWKKVLYQVDPATQKPRPMTLHEAQTYARQDNRWWKTQGGKEQDAGMANFMLKTFGKRA